MTDKLYGKTMEAHAAVLERDIDALQERLRESQRTLEKSTKFSDLFAYLGDIIASYPPIATVKPLRKKDLSQAVTKETAVLMLSDMHADQLILPQRVQDLENFNFDVACHRGDRLVKSVIKLLTDNLNGYRFDKLVIFIMGDLTTGDIHGGREHTHWGNSIKNSLGIGELIAQMINELSEHFEIDVIAVSGNHGRRSKKKDYRGPHDNWDFLISRFAQARCQSLIESKRVTFNIPDSFTACATVRGWNFVVNHGDDIRGVQGIPWYGMERRTRRLTAIGALTGVSPNYFLYGHFHTHTSQQHTTGEILVNGSWPATDEYALEALGATSEPSQWLFGVHEHYGITWRFPIHLRVKNWREVERAAPRYSITV